MFLGPGYFCPEYRVAWHLLLNLYIWFTISPCYCSIPLALGLIGGNGGLSNNCLVSGFCCQQRVIKTVPGPLCLGSDEKLVEISHLLGNFCTRHHILSCYGSILLALGLTWRNGGFSNQCQSCSFCFQQRVLKSFSCPDYHQSKDEIVWLWYLLVNFYICLTTSSCHGSIPLALGLIGRNGRLMNQCHSCWFFCPKRVLRTLSGAGYLTSEDGLVWLWNLLVNLYIWLTISSSSGSIPWLSGWCEGMVVCAISVIVVRLVISRGC